MACTTPGQLEDVPVAQLCSYAMYSPENAQLLLSLWNSRLLEINPDVSLKSIQVRLPEPDADYSQVSALLTQPFFPESR
jgi:hypothetical protein